MLAYVKSQCSGSLSAPQQPSSTRSAADLLVPGQRLVEEVEQVVMQGNDPLHELHVPHEAAEVVREELDGRDRSDAARVERGGVHMAPFHQAEHLPRVAAHLKSLAVELSLDGVEGAHDVGDRAVTVLPGVRCLGALG